MLRRFHLTLNPTHETLTTSAHSQAFRTFRGLIQGLTPIVDHPPVEGPSNEEPQALEHQRSITAFVKGAVCLRLASPHRKLDLQFGCATLYLQDLSTTSTIYDAQGPMRTLIPSPDTSPESTQTRWTESLRQYNNGLTPVASAGGLGWLRTSDES
ncbi:hypothetical protein C8R44DRAFT_744024 [Mycena epipterygia]|nr:hypothetical protein C8R44DRAFT_744024 [Mycena epipterygia]